MDNELRGSVSTIIGVLFALMLTILSSLGFFSNEIILNPYFWATIIIIILLLLIIAVYIMNKWTKKDLENTTSSQKNIVKDLENFKNSFEEKFKIYDRLNRLELEVFNGKKKLG